MRPGRDVAADPTLRNAVCFAASLLLAAAGYAPPAKGEALYVAATLKKIPYHDRLTGANTTYDMAACEKLVLKKSDPKKRTWTVIDLMGNEVRLQGTWQPWILRNKEECRDLVAHQGEAPVVKSGEVFTLAAPAKEK
jgi:hypothetical protein